MTRRARSIWERLAMESMEGPTVTISLPRELAQELVGALMGSLELDGGGGHAEPDEDDFGGTPDGDADDMDPLAALVGDDGESDLDPEAIGGPDDSDAPAGDSEDEDDDEDDEPEESFDRGRARDVRPGTALGERRRRR